VWMRGRAASDECPTSAVTPLSLEWLEKFYVWRFAGDRGLLGLAARDAEAFLTLEQERSRE
jgi:hypothetical protein